MWEIFKTRSRIRREAISAWRRDANRVRPSVRKYAAAKVDNLTHSMTRQQRPADVDIQQSLNTLRARSREEMQNNPFAKRINKLLMQNVIGAEGIRLQPRPLANAAGLVDTFAATRINENWVKWGKRGSPEVTETMSWRTICKRFVSSMFVDGEVVLVRHNNWNRNPFRYAVRFIDPVQLDVELNRDLGDGSVIRMGVELSAMGAPVAYHFTKFKRTDEDYRISSMRQHERIEAERVLHVFDPEFTYQTRGIPHLSASLLQFHHLRGYQYAELIAAREGASKLAWWQDAETGETFEGDDEDDDGNPIIDAAEPGQYGRIRHGVSLVENKPEHPTTQYADFVKSTLRSATSVTGAQYSAVSGDLEGVNFSSLRQSNLWAQDEWRDWQQFVIETLCEWVYPAWLSNALLTELHLDISGEQKYQNVIWRPRRWEHVQPKEQAVANTTSLQNRTTSISAQIIAAGNDPDEVFAQIAADAKKLSDLGITQGATDEQKPAATQTSGEDGESEPDDGSNPDDGSEPDDEGLDADDKNTGAVALD